MQCPRCYQENRQGRRFCSECGASLALACPSCGFSNEPGAKFCGGCGQPLRSTQSPAARFASPESYTPKHLVEKILTSKVALEGERKQVTVLFADLKGSMELLADRDPEEARKVLDPVLELMMEAVHNYEGTVNQVMGDGIMAIFGAPLAHEDHAVRACYAALRMQEALKRYAGETSRSHGGDVQIRIGLNSGEVVVRSIGSDLRMDYTAVGQTTHLAARMEQTAEPGAILMTGNVLRLVDGFVQVQPLGSVTVKGLSAPVETFALVGTGPRRSRLQAAAGNGLSKFVGREAEMVALRKALEQARSGQGQVVALVGEPGVGKSRVYWELAHSAGTEGWLILEGDCQSHGKTISFLPVIELLRVYFRVELGDDAGRSCGKIRAKLLSLDLALEPDLPAVFWLLGLPVDDSDWDRVDSRAHHDRAIESVKRILIRESQNQPVLLLVENLHWVDAETQSFLNSLVESLPTARLLLLVNYRSEYQHVWAGKSYYHQIRINPLPPESVDELLRALLGQHPSLPPLKRLLIQRAEGNPFFLEESVRELFELNVVGGERGACRLTASLEMVEKRLHIPPTAQAIVAARIDRLAPADKRLLQAAAVIGHDLPLPLLLAIAEDGEAAVREGLARLQAAEFLYERELFPNVVYTFKHALTHEVAYGSLLQARSRAMHARVVAAIETLYRDQLGDHLERLAHHAYHGRLWDRALIYLQEAGSRAFSRSAQPAAVDWFEKALEVLAHLPETPATLQRGLELRLDLRNALVPLGQFPRILGVLGEAEQLALRLGDRRRLGLIYSFLTNYFQVTGEPERGIDHGRRALELAAAVGDTATEIVATAFLASAHFNVGDYPLATQFARRSSGAARGTPASERFGMANLPSVYARATLARALAELGHFQEATEVAAEALDIAETSEHRVSLALASFSTGFVHLRRGDLEAAVTHLVRAVQLSRAVNRIWFRHIACTLATAYAHAGRAPEALLLLDEADTQAASIGLAGAPLGHGLQLAAQAETLLALGQAPDARQVAERALEYFETIKARGYQAWTQRLLAAAMSQPAVATTPAEILLMDALTLAEKLGMRPLEARCHLDLGTLYRRAGKNDQARRALITAGELFRSLGMETYATRVNRVFDEEI